MNKIIFVFTAICVAFGSVVQAAVITTPVTIEEFETVFSFAYSRPVVGSGAVWYAKFQAGNIFSTSNTFDQWEVEIGNVSGATDYGHTTWTFQGTYDFNIAVDGANNLTASFNGAGAGDGYPIIGSFNEIWVQLRIGTGYPFDTINVTNHEVNSLGLSNMTVSGSIPAKAVLQSFKFHFDDKLANIGEFDLSGKMFLDVSILAIDKDWTYTVVGLYNPEIPEPSSSLLLLLAISSLFARRNLYRSIR